MKIVVLAKDSHVVCEKVSVTETMFERLTGLLGRDHYSEDCAMWIKPCSSIHTFFMRFPIDVFFLDREMHIVLVRRDVKPWRCVLGPSGSFSVLETAAGAISNRFLNEGEVLKIL